MVFWILPRCNEIPLNRYATSTEVRPRYVYTTLTDVCVHQFYHVSASISRCEEFSKMANKNAFWSFIISTNVCRRRCVKLWRWLTVMVIPLTSSQLETPGFSHSLHKLAHCSFYGVIKGSEWKHFAVVCGEVNTWKFINFSNTHRRWQSTIGQSSTLASYDFACCRSLLPLERNLIHSRI